MEHFLDIFGRFGGLITALVTELFVQLRDPNCVRKEVVCRVLRRVSNDAISGFDYKSYRDYLGHKCFDTGYFGGLCTKHDYIRPGPFRDFYEFVKACGKDSEASSRLLQRLQAQVSQIPEGSEYMAYYLRALMGSLALAVDTTSQDARSCIRSLAKACVVWIMGNEPPPAENWARPDEVWKCNEETECKRCADFNTFLRDANAESHTIYPGRGVAYNSVKIHLERCFEGNIGYTILCRVEEVESETSEERGSRLCYTKTLKGWESKREWWAYSRESVQKDLKELPQLERDKLKELLGDDDYGCLISLDYNWATSAAAAAKRPRDGEADASGSGTESTLVLVKRQRRRAD